ncbi:synaptobrevin homolog YKT6 [Patella vulgata]|uniref:synaptobrevin homolog YKT6 n=1 Tax=Patella vulgata TaxID=6465 RepID=UPI00217F7DBE|nr:synaptobrevin homolog YKT6 [Patella vulgata]
MKLFSLSVSYKSPDGKVQQLKCAHELSSFGYFQRGSIREFMEFTSKIIVERTAVCSRASVKEQDYICHVSVRSDNLAGVVIADHEYPQRVAHTLINKVLDEFSSKISKQQWPVLKESEVNFTTLPDYLQKYQNPKESDAMTRIQSDLDETKIILYNTMESVLQRGEKLDDLVEKSEGLSTQSKTFYKTAKKTNSCCVIL